MYMRTCVQGELPSIYKQAPSVDPVVSASQTVTQRAAAAAAQRAAARIRSVGDPGPSLSAAAAAADSGAGEDAGASGSSGRSEGGSAGVSSSSSGGGSDKGSSSSSSSAGGKAAGFVGGGGRVGGGSSAAPRVTRSQLGAEFRHLDVREAGGGCWSAGVRVCVWGGGSACVRARDVELRHLSGRGLRVSSAAVARAWCACVWALTSCSRLTIHTWHAMYL